MESTFSLESGGWTSYKETNPKQLQGLHHNLGPVHTRFKSLEVNPCNLNR